MAEVWLGVAVLFGVIALISLAAWRSEQGYRAHNSERYLP